MAQNRRASRIMAGSFLLMQFNWRAKDYLATDGGCRTKAEVHGGRETVPSRVRYARTRSFDAETLCHDRRVHGTSVRRKSARRRVGCARIDLVTDAIHPERVELRRNDVCFAGRSAR